MDPAGSIIGSPLAELAWGALEHSEWPTATLPERYRTPQRIDVETLILSGGDDVATVAIDEYLAYFTNCKWIVLDGAGHMDLTSRPLEKAFFTDGKADESVYEHRPRSFIPAVSFQDREKAIVAHE
jgi:pimeloyl-ACP methyl ester carboxylesterase